MKSGFTARWGRTFFTTTKVLKPDSSPCLARYTSAMPPTASRESSWYRPRVTNCCTAGPGVGVGACKPMPIGGKGVRRPVLSTGDGPLAGVAAGFFVPVSTTGGGLLVGVAAGWFVPVLTTGGGPAGTAREVGVTPVLTTGGEPLPVV